MGDPQVDPMDSPDLELTDGGTADSTSHPLLSSQEVAIDNTNASGGAAQTVTLVNRGKGGGSFTVVVNAGFAVKLSGRGARSYAFGSTDANVLWRVGPRGSVWPVLGFSAPTGVGGGTIPTSINYLWSNGTPQYFQPGWSSTDDQVGTGLSSSQAAIPAPRAGTLKNLVANMVTNANAQSGTITLFKNGVATALQVTYAAGITGAANDLVHTVAVAQGDLISIELKSAAGTNSWLVFLSWEFD